MSCFLQLGWHTQDLHHIPMIAQYLAQNVFFQMQIDINFPETINYSITVTVYQA